MFLLIRLEFAFSLKTPPPAHPLHTLVINYDLPEKLLSTHLTFSHNQDQLVLHFVAISRRSVWDRIFSLLLQILQWSKAGV